MTELLAVRLKPPHREGPYFRFVCPRGGEWETVWFECTPDLGRYLVPKGSIAVDGISLTVVDVEPDRFSVMLIPHTLQNTTLGIKPVSAQVNLETDILAKYVFRAVEPTRE